MKTEDFQTLSAEIDKLTPHQRKLLSKRLDKIQNVQAVNTLIESKVATATVCPKCAHDKIARWGSASGLQRYRCVACKATFNALTGTPLARLRKKEKWLDYAQQMQQGASVRKSAILQIIKPLAKRHVASHIDVINYFHNGILKSTI